MKYLACVAVVVFNYGVCTLITGACAQHWEPASNAVIVVLLLDAAIDRLIVRLK